MFVGLDIHKKYTEVAIVPLLWANKHVPFINQRGKNEKGRWVRMKKGRAK